MKKLFWSAIALSFATLLLTNPSDKKQYVDHLAFRAHERCGWTAPLQRTSVNARFNPFDPSGLEVQAYRFAMDIHTQKPRNYRILTIFYTQSRQLRAVGIGIAGQFIVIPQHEADCLRQRLTKHLQSP
jgi:hypothetical protein